MSKPSNKYKTPADFRRVNLKLPLKFHKRLTRYVEALPGPYSARTIQKTIAKALEQYTGIPYR